MPVETCDMPENSLYVAGEWRTGGGAEIESRFPADMSLNGVINGASAEDGHAAIEAATRAQSSAGWLALKPHDRARYLHAIAAGLEANRDRIAYIQSRDTGKTLAETGALAMSAAGTFRYYAAVCETSDEILTTPRGDYLTLSTHEPLGVVAAISPWNSPIASDAQKIAPALAAGNAVIVKPSSWSTLVSLELARIIEAAGLPEGLFSVLPGSGSEIGELLVTHPEIAKVSFTGGTATGRRIAEKAAKKLMPVSLELGGKSPTVVFADCDIDQAVAGVMFGIFSSTGQSCIAGSRLFVEASIHDEFLARLLAATERLVVGHPHDAATQVAPLIRPEHRANIEALIERAKADGADVLIGAARPADPVLSEGSYYLPTILGSLKNDAEICREEVFGPVLTVLPFDGEDDVIAMANDNEYGLAAGLWSRDIPKCLRVAKAIRTGTVWINTYKQFSISTPFGGEKASGTGREKGRDGMRAYMRQKSIYLYLSGEPHPWARMKPTDGGLS